MAPFNALRRHGTKSIDILPLSLSWVQFHTNTLALFYQIHFTNFVASVYHLRILYIRQYFESLQFIDLVLVCQSLTVSELNLGLNRARPRVRRLGKSFDLNLVSRVGGETTRGGTGVHVEKVSGRCRRRRVPDSGPFHSRWVHRDYKRRSVEWSRERRPPFPSLQTTLLIHQGLLFSRPG